MLSIFCYWEVVIEVRKGLLVISDPVVWRSRATDALGGSVLSIRAAHISALSALPDLHRDPFDRILLAQAVAEGLALVTSDEQIRRYAVKTIW